MFQKLLYLSVFVICTVNSARILSVFPTPSPSHYFLGNGLVTGLLEAGHDVTMVAAFSDEKLLQKFDKTYTEVILTGAKEAFAAQNKNFFGRASGSPLLRMGFISKIFLEATEKALNHTNVQKLLKSGQNFDVVILEEFHNTAEKMFAVHFKAPLILFCTSGSNAWVNDLVGNPAPPSYVPDIFMNSSGDLSFFERVFNSIMFLVQRLAFHWYALPGHQQLARKYFPEIDNDKSLDHVLYNASLVLLNSHPSTNSPVPHVPNMIEIGGLHIQPPKELPADLKEFLDNAKEGVVYFSMGSNLKSADIPLEKRNAIIQTLSKLKQKVLWKFEDDSLSRQLPPNVMIRKWLPQNDILAHKNVKLFITHGGLLSTTETIYHGVPVLAIPVFGDQGVNAQKIANSGFGLAVPYPELNAENFAEKLHELLNNPKYAENAKRRSKIFHDRISTPLETAVYWVEYVIRHQGAPHLRVAGVDLPWYKYLLLDVVLFLAVLGIILSFIFCRIIKKLKNKFCGCNKKQKKVKTN